MFSFGYKNLYEPKTIEPGPGFYEIREYFKPISPQLKKQPTYTKSARSITNNNSSFEHKLKNHHGCYQEYYTSLNKSSEIQNKNKQQFSTSKRSDLLILPQISKGPQYYNIKQKRTEHSISIGSYSGRKPLFGIEERLSKSQKPQKSNEKQKEKIAVHYIDWANKRFKERVSHSNSNSPFRDYSYLPKDEKYGPTLIDFPAKQLKGNTFNKSPRFNGSNILKHEEEKNDQAGEMTGYEESQVQLQKEEKLKKYFQQLVEEKMRLERVSYKSSPKYQFPQSDTSKTSLYRRQLQFDKSLEPGPGYYKV